MIIWSGFGILVPVIMAVCALLTQLLIDGALHDDKYYDTHAWPATVAMMVTALFVWLLSRRLSQQPGRRLVDPATGKDVILQPRHSLFFVPLRYWPPILMVFGVVLIFR